VGPAGLGFGLIKVARFEHFSELFGGKTAASAANPRLCRPCQAYLRRPSPGMSRSCRLSPIKIHLRCTRATARTRVADLHRRRYEYVPTLTTKTGEECASRLHLLIIFISGRFLRSNFNRLPSFSSNVLSPRWDCRHVTMITGRISSHQRTARLATLPGMDGRRSCMRRSTVMRS
jgi:hypothetical protein